MDQTRRLILFVLITVLVWGGWFGFLAPRFFPPQKKVPPVAADLDEADDVGPEAGDKAAGANGAAAAPANAEASKPQLTKPDNPHRTVVLGAEKPESGYFQQVTLDSRGASVESITLNDDRYRNLSARNEPLTIVGATPDPPVTTFATGVASIDAQLAEFETDAKTVDWKVAEVGKDADGVNDRVTFSLTAPDGSVELTKTYRLSKVKDGGSPYVRDTEPKGYLLDVELGFRNLTDERKELVYTLQGPEGLPLENEEHTSKYRELELGFLDEDGDLNSTVMAARDVSKKVKAAREAEKARTEAAAADRLVKKRQAAVTDLQAQVAAKPGDAALKAKLDEAQKALGEAEQSARDLTDAAQAAAKGLERWSKPFRYLGVEVQYFAALLMPQDPRPLDQQSKSPWVAKAEPELVAERPDPQYDDISFSLTSAPVVLQPKGTATQSWRLYAGPKRKELLSPLGADAILDTYSWITPISQGMLWVLNKIHGLGAPYWLAIICLTVLVRGAMFPISRKQAIGAAKMKELQPKIAEIKAKYGTDQEKFIRAQTELFRKHGYGPLGPMASGCLPVFLQLPIFMGLYQALQTSIDLRQAEFLWIDNLAAPDRLWREPWPPQQLWLPLVGNFTFPFVGGDVNVLPVITVALFYIQQKLFMPPATTPEQEAQYKMMNFMMLFMGIFFYHVPAGLCVYFIASSLWSIAERTLLAKTKAAHVGAAEAAQIDREIEEVTHDPQPTARAVAKGKPGKPAPKGPAPERKQGFFGRILERLFEAAEEARRQSELGGDQKSRPAGPKSRTKR